MAPTAPFRAVRSADAAAIRELVAEQLAAFARDDGAAAFALASPGIRRRFGDAQRFLDAVRAHYAIVHRPRSVIYLDVIRVDGRYAQRLLLLGFEDDAADALYYVLRMPDGTLRTDGCRLFPRTPLPA